MCRSPENQHHLCGLHAGTTHTVAVIFFLLLGVLHSASRAEPKDTVNFSLRHDAIILPVKIGTRTYKFAVVTGATFHVFDKSLRKHLGKRLQTAMIEGVRVGVFAKPQMFVGKTELTAGQSIVMTDLAAIRKVLGAKISGFLGIDMFRSDVVRINFDQGTVTFLRPAIRPRRAWGTRHRVAMRFGNSPTLKLAIGDVVQPVWCLVNTGNSSTGHLNRSIYTKLKKTKRLRHFGSNVVVTAGGVLSHEEGELTELQFAGIQIRSLIFSSTEGHCMIGLGFLKRFHVTFDIPRKAIYFVPGKRVKDPDLKDRCGMYLIDHEGRPLVHFVDKNSI